MTGSLMASAEEGGEINSSPVINVSNPSAHAEILVTGASGFLGQHLVRRLSAEGKTVRALYHRSKPGIEMAALPHVTWEACNLLDIYDVADALQGITDIYHCAATVSFDPAH